MTAPKDVVRLVEHFERNIESYRSPSYKEAHVRTEFIDPMFEALGWDIANRAGYAEPYKDVVHEDAIRIGGASKAPDYCFRIGGTRKFFVEAKKPTVDIKGGVSPARQAQWKAELVDRQVPLWYSHAGCRLPVRCAPASSPTIMRSGFARSLLARCFVLSISSAHAQTVPYTRLVLSRSNDQGERCCLLIFDPRQIW